ncbi:MAG: hypothetical protein ABI262_13080 [Microcoleus sp.]
MLLKGDFLASIDVRGARQKRSLACLYGGGFLTAKKGGRDRTSLAGAHTA